MRERSFDLHHIHPSSLEMDTKTHRPNIALGGYLIFGEQPIDLLGKFRKSFDDQKNNPVLQARVTPLDGVDGWDSFLKEEKKREDESVKRVLKTTKQELELLTKKDLSQLNFFFGHGIHQARQQITDQLPQLPDKIKKIFTFALSGDDKRLANGLSVAFIEGQLPDDVFENALIAYYEQTTLRENQFKEQFPTLQKEIKADFERALREKQWDIPQERVDRIFRTTRVTLKHTMDRFETQLGSYSLRKGITLAFHPNFSYDEYRGTLTHEYLHALSGRTIVSKTIDSPNGKRQILSQQRLGLSFGKYSTNTEIFGWLNEAVTEDMTHELLGERGVPAYKIERQALREWLVQAGIPLELIRRAYFEDFDPLAPEGKRVPAWKEFLKKIRQIYKASPTKFLKSADQRIAEIKNQCLEDSSIVEGSV